MAPLYRFSLRATIINDTGESTVHLPLEEAPGFLHLPKLAPAAFLSGQPPVNGTSICGSQTLYFGKPPEKVAASLGTKGITSTSNLDVPAFARILAKIGYGFAVAHYGMYPLEEVPVLPCILGLADDASTWLGSADYRLPIEDKKPTHAIGLRAAAYTNGQNTHTVLIAQVKLFAASGATGYEVVVRRSRQS
jgi:hypothetical protein